jgi:hypothetical protein
MWEHHWSESVVQYAVWLSGLVTFAEAATILATIGEIPIAASSIWRRVAVWGPKCQALEATQRAASAVAPTREELTQTVRLTGQDLGVAMDGGMVHIREEGWKELKVGCVFAIRQQPTCDKHTGEIVDLAHAVSNTYVAHLGGPAVFGDLLWAEARQRHWMQARDTIVLGDGASWIWNLAADKFFTSRQVVDWYHAKLHLTQAATALHGEGTATARRWLRDHETPLLQGHAERLARTLRQLAQKTLSLCGHVTPRSRLLPRQLSPHAISRNPRRRVPHRQRHGRECLQTISRPPGRVRHALVTRRPGTLAAHTRRDHEPALR